MKTTADSSTNLESCNLYSKRIPAKVISTVSIKKQIQLLPLFLYTITHAIVIDRMHSRRRTTTTMAGITITRILILGLLGVVFITGVSNQLVN